MGYILIMYRRTLGGSFGQMRSDDETRHGEIGTKLMKNIHIPIYGTLKSFAYKKCSPKDPPPTPKTSEDPSPTRRPTPNPSLKRRGEPIAPKDTPCDVRSIAWTRRRASYCRGRASCIRCMDSKTCIHRMDSKTCIRCMDTKTSIRRMDTQTCVLSSNCRGRASCRP